MKKDRPFSTGVMRYAAEAYTRFKDIGGQLAAQHDGQATHVLISGKTGKYIVFCLDEHNMPSAADARRIAEFMANIDMNDDTMLTEKLCPTSH